MYAQVNGIKIFFDIEGGGGLVPNGPVLEKRPTVLVLHGGPGCDHSYFKPWLSPLAEVCQLVYVDHRGNGRSDRTDQSTYTIEQMADDLEALRLQLGLGEVIVFGHSFGGMVAQTYALKYPDSYSKLILAATTPSYEFWDEAQEIAEATATEAQKAIVNDLFEGRITSQAQHDEWWRTCMSMYFHKPDHELIAEELKRMIGAVDVTNYMMKHELPSFNVRDRLHEITVPTLVIGGEHDWVTPPSQSRAIADRIPGAELVIMDDCGHMGFAEEPDAYIGYLRAFITAP
jgi:proline iminopeptidase